MLSFSDDICLIWSFRWWGGGWWAILLRPHEFRNRTAGPTSSALRGSNACIRRALCCVKAALTSVCLVMRSLPRKMRPEQQQNTHTFCSPCFFPASSRSPPECTPHSKATKKVMRLRLRLFFPFFLTPCFRSLMIFVLYGHSSGGWWGDSLERRVPEMDRRCGSEPTSSALSGPYAYIKKALCCV